MTATVLLGIAALFTLVDEKYKIDSERSIFAVITQRGGIAARMAHDHLITADGFSATINSSGDAVSGFSFQCETEELLVDDPKLKKQWSKNIADAGVLRSPFKTISAADRKTVRKHMLDKDQLNAKQYREIEAKVISVTKRENTFRDQSYSHVAELEFTVHGETVTRDVSANISVDEGAITVEAVGSFRFTEFGIEPYSTFLGAVRNLDEFFVYCSLHAERDRSGASN